MASNRNRNGMWNVNRMWEWAGGGEERSGAERVDLGFGARLGVDRSDDAGRIDTEEVKVCKTSVSRGRRVCCVNTPWGSEEPGRAVF